MDSIINAIIGVIGVGVGAGLAGFFARQKTQAEAEQAEADTNEQIRATVMLLIQPLRDRVTELETEVATLKVENCGLKEWAALLVKQVKGMGGVPVAMPEPKTQPRK